MVALTKVRDTFYLTWKKVIIHIVMGYDSYMARNCRKDLGEESVHGQQLNGNQGPEFYNHKEMNTAQTQ